MTAMAMVRYAFSARSVRFCLWQGIDDPVVLRFRPNGASGILGHRQTAAIDEA
jgi:hypothetical protein